MEASAYNDVFFYGAVGKTDSYMRSAKGTGFEGNVKAIWVFDS